MYSEDEKFMRLALQEAQIAFRENEVPVGCIITIDNKIIARGHNQTETLNDVTAHAEMIALTAAFNHLGSKYLREATLYVTVEPCLMCAGALFWAKIGKVVYGCDDKNGFSTKYKNAPFHKKTVVVKHIMAQECATLMQSFFQSMR